MIGKAFHVSLNVITLKCQPSTYVQRDLVKYLKSAKAGTLSQLLLGELQVQRKWNDKKRTSFG